MSSLKYFFPALPKKPGDKAKPLTNDQKYQNTLFNRECRRVWRLAEEELITKIEEYIDKKENGIDDVTQEKNGKAAADKGGNNNDDRGNKNLSRDKLEQMALNDLSIQRLVIYLLFFILF